MDKNDILDSIKRIADANNSQPPGKFVFEKETGIKESFWSGRYWTKWSEALVEAGFTPNVLNPALPEENLLKNYASLIDELGHVPTNAELRMRSRDDSDFPAHTTFSNRLGKKKELLGAVLEFCSEHEEFQHLVPLIEEVPHTKPDEIEKSTDNQNENVGYVYLMQFGKEYKIGTSQNVERRFREMKTQMPYEGKIIHTITTGDPEGIEAYWHKYFADKRLKGEWFALTASDVKYFKKRKLM